MLGREPAALTGVEVAWAIREVGVDEGLVVDVLGLLESDEQRRYDPKGGVTTGVHDWLGLARRVQGQLMSLLAIWLAIGSLDDVRADEWTEAERLFDRALDLPATEDSQAGFVEAALAFEHCAERDRLAGLAWTNAGNAWFQAGELGRSIAAYRRAEGYRPFDRQLEENLAAARALWIDAVTEPESSGFIRWPLALPVRWQLALVAFLWLLLWGLLLLKLRYPSRLLRSVALVLWLILGLVVVPAMTTVLADAQAGVIIASEVQGRKGPGHGYQKAFGGVFHQGLEFCCGEHRGAWVEIILSDQTRAWVPSQSVELIPW